MLEKLDTEQLKKVNLHLARTMRKRVKESSNSTIKIHRDKVTKTLYYEYMP